MAAGVFASATAVIAQSNGRAPELLYRMRQWFELRSAVTARSPALLRGAVAAAFNDPAQAERMLREIVRSNSRSDGVDDAYGLLSQLYLQSGQYARFLRHYEAFLTP